MEKQCKICNKLYKVEKRKFETSTFCSNVCRFASYRLSDVYLQCKTCGKQFLRKKNELKAAKKGSYCSVECYSKRSPQRLVTCVCGKHFFAYSSRIAYYGTLYCSNECRYKYQLTCSIEDIPDKNSYHDFTRKLRHTARYYLWKKECLTRDGYRCQCGNTNALTVHHKIQILEFVRKHGMNKEKIEADPMFFDIKNGITLCRSCHFQQHHVNRNK